MENVTKRELEIFADIMEGTAGWMNKVKDFWGEQTEEYAEKYIDAKSKHLQEEKDYYHLTELLKVRERIKEFKEENKEFAKECQARKDKELQEIFNEKCKTLEQSLEHYGNLEEKKKLFKEIESLKKEMSSKISNEMIEKARNYPITDLIENKKNFCLCPFHDDHHPSLYLRKNFYYCFSCNAHGSVIDLYMHLNNVNFVEAVRSLQN